ncbi:MAG: gamma-glutamylcyclotransferase family protein [Pseudomonadota bacterium]
MPDRFFGYGSLVNAATHDYAGVTPARVSGWRRQWVPSRQRPVSFLSVTPDPVCSIDGVIAEVGAIGWDGLDEREAAYDRLVLPEPHAGVQIYRATADKIDPSAPRLPILLSYLDVVVQGYYRIYGEDGVRSFFRTTTGWETGVLNDRRAPIYPRAQELSAEETALTDSFLQAQGTAVLERT